MRFLSMLAVLAVFSPGLGAQTQLSEVKLPGPFGSIGDRVGVAGDVDGDFINDVLVAGPVGVFTYSGVDGERLHVLEISLSSLLNVRGAGDLDGDSQLDIVVASSDSVRAYSRADGSLLWTYAGSAVGSIGWRMGVLNDVNGDEVLDIAAGEPDADPLGISSAGRVHVISGADGTPIHVIDGTGDHQQLGRSIAVVHDIDRDGRDDILVGDTHFDAHGQTVGRLLVLAALDGEVLLEQMNDTPTFNFAIEVADAGDIDDDGTNDLGALSVIGSAALCGVYSGSTGDVIWSVGTSGTFNLVSVGDANGDQIPELVSASPGYFTSPGFGRLHDGATGATLQNLTGSSSGSFLSIAAPGDVTGDGHGDLLVGSAQPGFGTQPPNAQLRSLPSGSVVYTLSNPPGGTQLGWQVDLAGDFDGDERDDYALLGMDKIVVFSSADGEPLKEIPIPKDLFFLAAPTAVAGIGDVDGDEVPDLVMGDGTHGASTGFFNGAVRFYSGADGSLIDDLFGASDEEYGQAVEDTGDLDGDDVRDLYVGIPGRDILSFADAGQVLLLSGDDRSVLDTLQGAGQQDGRFGISVSAGGDLTGDGVRDLAVGSQDDGPGQFNAGALYLFDGDGGAPIARIDGALNSVMVTGAIVGDADGDEIADVLVAEQRWMMPGESTFRGRVRLVSGADRHQLWVAQGGTNSEQFGQRFCAAGDIDGDGYGDVAVGASTPTGASVTILSGLTGGVLDQLTAWPGTGAGLGGLASAGHIDAGNCSDLLIGLTLLDNDGGARVFAGSDGGPHGFEDVGFAKAGTGGVKPTCRGYGDLAPEEIVSVRARHALPGAIGVWFLGLEAGYFPFKKGTLVPSPLGLFFDIPIVADGNGEVDITAPNPPGPLTGISIYHQFWFRDTGVPGKVSATNGMEESFK